MSPKQRMMIIVFQLIIFVNMFQYTFELIIPKFSSPFEFSRIAISKNNKLVSNALRSIINGAILSLISIPSDTKMVLAMEDYLHEAETQTIRIFEESTPSVVFINTFVEKIDVFSMNVMEVAAGTGTGFIWDKEGHVVTNYHVIRNAASAKITITCNNGKTSKTVKGNVVGVDPDKDVAVLQLDLPVNEAASLKPIQVGSSSQLRVGQFALAIGNPFGLDHTLTTGVVSGLGREVRSPNNRPISNVIQTDASINPGNSGGPLLDGAGKLIGMNTAIFSLSGSSSGIGFAIPVDTLKYEVTSLIRDGQVVHPALGITYLETSQARNLGIRNGILVLDVPTASPAANAGVQSTKRTSTGEIELGDIIIGINENAIDTESDLFKAIDKYSVGDHVTLKILRSMSSKGDEVEGNIGRGFNNLKFIPLELEITLSSQTSKISK